MHLVVKIASPLFFLRSDIPKNKFSQVFFFEIRHPHFFFKILLDRTRFHACPERCAPEYHRPAREFPPDLRWVLAIFPTVFETGHTHPFFLIFFDIGQGFMLFSSVEHSNIAFFRAKFPLI